MLTGFRFRKAISIFPGFRVNVSKGGISESVGGHGVTLNLDKTLTPYVTLGWPGSGMSYRMPVTGAIWLLLLLAVVAVGTLYVISPEMIRQGLHWWQPRWF